MISNKQKGNVFAERVRDYPESKGIYVEREYEIEVGINSQHKKNHKFDWGNEALLVECKVKATGESHER